MPLSNSLLLRAIAPPRFPIMLCTRLANRHCSLEIFMGWGSLRSFQPVWAQLALMTNEGRGGTEGGDILGWYSVMNGWMDESFFSFFSFPFLSFTVVAVSVSSPLHP